MKEISLHNRKGDVITTTQVDDENYDLLMQWRWSYSDMRRGLGGYAIRTEKRDNTWKTIYMHRFIMNAPAGSHIDHIDLNSLNNRKSNLRFATTRQNRTNQAKYRGAYTSQFKGVSWYPRDSKWRVLVDRRFIGCYANELDAAHAYDEAARIHQGEFARLNFPHKQS